MAKRDKEMRFKSLRTSMMLFVCGLIALSAIIFAITHISFSYQSEKQNTNWIMSHFAERFSELAVKSIQNPDDSLSLTDQFSNIMGNIETVETFGDDLSLVSSNSDNTYYSDQISKLAEIARDTGDYAFRKEGYGAFGVAPVLSDGEIVGYVGFKVRQVHLPNTMLRAVLWSIATAGIVGAAAIALALLFIQNVTKPLGMLTEFASGISANQLSARVEVQSDNEFNTLANAFNSMMERMEVTMRQMQRLAFVDPVTALPNREHFQRRLSKVLKNRSDESFAAVIILNVDRFRWVNETLGTDRGDEALSLIGMRIKKSLLSADKVVRVLESGNSPCTVARIGGDEFAVLVPEVASKTDISRLMQLIISSMRQPLEIGGQSLTLGLSAGVALAPIHGLRPDELLKNADLALKEARRSGRGKARFYSTKLNKIAMDRLHLEADLRRAIEKQEFIPFFQPKIDFKTGQISGAEALVRWKREDGDLISPGVFIPMAEQLGLISQIGDTVLQQACEQAAGWMKSGLDCKIAVNVSPLQFEDADFAEKVLNALRDAGLPPGRLELEITETMAVADTDRVTEIMRPLRAMGVRLAIDDFGAGHSNLVTLTRLPFDVFKIDQQFVSALHSDKQAPAIIDMILAMAETMGLETVAEGVETPSQSDFLRRRGCTLAQGYLYSKPLPPEEYAVFLKDWKPFGEVVNESFLERLEAS